MSYVTAQQASDDFIHALNDLGDRETIKISAVIDHLDKLRTLKGHLGVMLGKAYEAFYEALLTAEGRRPNVPIQTDDPRIALTVAFATKRLLPPGIISPRLIIVTRVFGDSAGDEVLDRSDWRMVGPPGCQPVLIVSPELEARARELFPDVPVDNTATR